VAFALGIDISTTTIGWCVINLEDFSEFVVDHISLDKVKTKTFWQKFDFAKQELETVISKYDIVKFGVEENLIGFTPHMSSANTIVVLAKFNAVISSYVRDRLSIDPINVKFVTARKVAGVLVQQKKKCGKTAKEQVIAQLTSEGKPLAFLSQFKTKTGKLKPWVGDRVDAWVIANFIK